ncbi:mechanosensitive ion channel family protein [Tellurirhabdus rosea]|uniref:mechanosensitive ion channel family protein n=1 Tax=Tellurirhabdus rosea TaxID=2674997 RepID=UPI002259A331|nr:mechanosensitive ion channel family protein [Tellurirhabdus rosea]
MNQVISEYFPLFQQYASRVLLAILTLVVGFWLIGRVVRLMTATLKHRHVDETIIPFLRSIVEVVLKVVLIISVAGMFGVQTTSFVALIGAAGLAIGLALQGSLSHFASGVMILMFKPYRVGDLISVTGFTGEVEAVHVFNTILKTLDNKRIIIPNSSITSGPITNISGQGTIRVDMQFNVAASEPVARVREVVQEVAASCPYVLPAPPVDVLVNSLQIGYVTYDIRPWCKSEHFWDTYYYMQENIKNAFDAQGIKGPKPAMDVSMAERLGPTLPLSPDAQPVRVVVGGTKTEK